MLCISQSSVFLLLPFTFFLHRRVEMPSWNGCGSPSTIDLNATSEISERPYDFIRVTQLVRGSGLGARLPGIQSGHLSTKNYTAPNL